MKKFKDILDELFKDIGKLSDTELMKGQALKEGEFVEVNGRVFHKVLSTIRNNDLTRETPKGLDSLSLYSVNDYKKMSCYLGKNNSSGYAIAHENELVSVFNTQGASGSAIVKDAIKNGASRLDCFAKKDKDGNISGFLHTLYSRFGFKIDTSLNSGEEGEAYSIRKGISLFVNDKGEVEPENENIVIFMKI